MLKWIPNPTGYPINNFVSGSKIYYPEYYMWLPRICACALWVIVNVSMAGKGSIVWHFFEVFNEDGKPRACCKMCNNLSLAYSDETENLLHHLHMKHPMMLDRDKGKKQTTLSSFKPCSSEWSVEITKAILLSVAFDLHPIAVADGIGVIKLLNYIEQGYRVPSRPHIKTTCRQEYNALKKLWYKNCTHLMFL